MVIERMDMEASGYLKKKPGTRPIHRTRRERRTIITTNTSTSNIINATVPERSNPSAQLNFPPQQFGINRAEVKSVLEK